MVASAPTRAAWFATATLLAITASWGSTFFLIHDLMDRMPAADFLAVRFAIAGATLLLLAPRAVGRMSPALRRRAVVLGLLYGSAQIAQTVGLAHTPASISGFITGLYVVATPLFAASLFRARIGPTTWVAVGVALTGLAVLSLDGLSLGFGESITLLGALIYALHIIGLSHWTSARDVVGLAVIQCLVIAAVSFVVALPGGVQLPDRPGDWAALMYMALIPGAAALLGQTWAQAHLPPVRTAIIMSMEPVFAALFAVLLGGETTTSRMVIGGGLVLAATLVVEIVPRRRARRPAASSVPDGPPPRVSTPPA